MLALTFNLLIRSIAYWTQYWVFHKRSGTVGRSGDFNSLPLLMHAATARFAHLPIPANGIRREAGGKVF